MKDEDFVVARTRKCGGSQVALHPSMNRLRIFFYLLERVSLTRGEPFFDFDFFIFILWFIFAFVTHDTLSKIKVSRLRKNYTFQNMCLKLDFFILFGL